ncbi:MAG: N-acetylmuramoyl-L-alanine amidase [Pseudomonadota bacterium]
MTRRAWIAIPLLLGISVPFAEAANSSALFDRGRARYLSAKTIQSPRMKRTAYLRAAGELKEFLDRYPNNPSAATALFDLGSIYRDLAVAWMDRDDAGRALHYYRNLVRKSPGDPRADDAVYEEGLICEKVFQDLKCRDEAFDRIRALYPAGDVVRRLPAKTVAGSSAAPASRVIPSAPSPTVRSRAEIDSVTFVAEEPSYLLTVTLDSSPTISSGFIPAIPEQNLPTRYYIDIENAHLPTTLKPPGIPENAPVTSVRLGQNTMETVRVVLDLSASLTPGDVTAETEGSSVKLTFRPAALVQGTMMPTIAPTPVPAPEKVVAPIVPRRMKIVVDPGHGGEDTGARGRRGTLEKDVALAIGKKLDALLSKSPHYEVFMTRTEDRALALGDRTNFANRVAGDLFVSIHANAAPRRAARGVSTYLLDNADDEESLRVARQENGELAVPQTGTSGKSEEYYLEVMKASMIKNFHTTQSVDLARNVQSELVSSLKKGRWETEDLGVRRAGFYVLTGAKMPAVLVETSFISNPTEEQHLRDPRYQERVAQAIFRGIERFFTALARELSHARLYRP